MKILAITSRFPPSHFGGYELRTKDILDGLSLRGHQVLVLTSKKETSIKQVSSPAAYPVIRRLHLKLDPQGWLAKLTLNRWTHPMGILLIFIREVILDIQDLGLIDNRIRDFQPDVIYLGHTVILTRGLFPYLAGINVPLVYDEGGSGLIDAWQEKGIWYKFVERRNRPGIINSLRFTFIRIANALSNDLLKTQWLWPEKIHSIFNSHLNRTNAETSGLPMGNSRVIHSGLDLEKFNYRPRVALNSPLSILVPGRIEPRKGQLDAVHMLSALHEAGLEASLTLVGEVWHPSYLQEIRNEIRTSRLEEHIHLLPMVAYEELVGLYYKADICFFPSLYKTGFSRIPLEAMACGCILVSYGNEGSDEVIHNGENGFLVEEDRFPDIVGIIQGLLEDPGKVGQITKTARKTIESNYDMEDYISRVDEVITEAIRMEGSGRA